MGDLIRKNLKAGKYALLDDPQAFAMKLSDDLQSVSHDRHLRAFAAPPEACSRTVRPRTRPSGSGRARPKSWTACATIGFKEVERLTGNVGYLEFNCGSRRRGRPGPRRWSAR